MAQCPSLAGNQAPNTQAEQCTKSLTGLLYCADCGAKLTHHNSLVQGMYIDDAFTCSRYRVPMEDCTIHCVSTQKLEAAKDCRKQIAQAKKRHAELDELVKKMYGAIAADKLPDKHFSRFLAEYDEEQFVLEVSMTDWQELLDNGNADRVRMAEFIDLAKQYTDFRN